jgi:hypothetical protein
LIFTALVAPWAAGTTATRVRAASEPARTALRDRPRVRNGCPFVSVQEAFSPIVTDDDEHPRNRTRQARKHWTT